MRKLAVFGAILSACLNLGAQEGLRTIASYDPLNRIEIDTQKATGAEIAPLVVFLHGAGQNGVKEVRKFWFDFMRRKGYSVAAISMPGFGDSTGRKDFCGPHTIKTIDYALDQIKEEMGVDDFGMFLWGQGAMAGLIAASNRDDVRCLISANGGYDLLRHQGEGGLLSRLKALNFDFDIDDQEQVLARSPMTKIDGLNTPVCLVHRQGAYGVKEDELVAFHNAMVAAGKECQLHFVDRALGDGSRDKLKGFEILRVCESWFDSKMH